jgi:hypothetical protein
MRYGRGESEDGRRTGRKEGEVKRGDGGRGRERNRERKGRNENRS